MTEVPHANPDEDPDEQDPDEQDPDEQDPDDQVPDGDELFEPGEALLPQWRIDPSHDSKIHWWSGG